MMKVLRRLNMHGSCKRIFKITIIMRLIIFSSRRGIRSPINIKTFQINSIHKGVVFCFFHSFIFIILPSIYQLDLIMEFVLFFFIAFSPQGMLMNYNKKVFVVTNLRQISCFGQLCVFCLGESIFLGTIFLCLFEFGFR